MAKRLTKIQIIEETVKFYSDVSKRAKSETGGCMYVTENGKFCAFSRCCTPKGRKILHEEFEGVTAADFDNCNEEMPTLKELLWPRYQGHPGYFWDDIQELHDNDLHWNLEEGGLNEYGEYQVQKLKGIYFN